MIRRQVGDRFLLFSQHDHALLSGQMAAHLGNSAFSAPTPRDAVVRAIALHDCGWPLHDDHPILNKDGLPLDVFETPLEIALKAWASAIDRVEAAGEPPYTRLLVSLHVFGLTAIAASHPHSRHEIFLLNQFQQREAERHETLRKELGLRTDMPLKFGLAMKPAGEGESNLTRNHYLLQFMDRISLGLCCASVVFPEVPNVVPAPGRMGISARLWRKDSWTLMVDPWPFDERKLTFEIPAKAVPSRRYADEKDFLDLFAQTPMEMIRLGVEMG